MDNVCMYVMYVCMEHTQVVGWFSGRVDGRMLVWITNG